MFLAARRHGYFIFITSIIVYDHFRIDPLIQVKRFHKEIDIFFNGALAIVKGMPFSFSALKYASAPFTNWKRFPYLPDNTRDRVFLSIWEYVLASRWVQEPLNKYSL